jgi:hypothetical protein
VSEILRKGDVLLASHTGSGKTLAYLLPLVSHCHWVMHPCSRNRMFVLVPFRSVSSHCVSPSSSGRELTTESHRLRCSARLACKLAGKAGECCVSAHCCRCPPGEAAEGLGEPRRGASKAKAAARHRSGTHQGADRPDPERGQVHQPPCKVPFGVRQRGWVTLSCALPRGFLRGCLL